MGLQGGAVSGKQFRHVLWEFGLIPTPVFVGNPSQSIAFGMDQIANFVRNNAGKNPCFISHNPVFEFAKGRYPQKTYYSKNFMDLDADPRKGLTKQDAMNDVRKLSGWFDEYALPYNVANSGSKGYHMYLRFKPEVHRIDRKLTDKIRAVQFYLIKNLGLRTLDMHVAEARRITRIPESPHVSNDGVKNGMYCIPMDAEMIHDMEPQDIDEVARAPYIPDEMTMNPNGNWYTLNEFIMKFNVPISYVGIPFDGNDPATTTIKEYKVVADEPFLKIMKDIIRRPCIYRELVVEDRPAHIARVDACVEIRNLGFTLQEALNLFDLFAHAANWHDQHNTQRRYANVRSIFMKDPPYKPATCSTLKRHGLCVGKVCPFYREDY